MNVFDATWQGTLNDYNRGQGDGSRGDGSRGRAQGSVTCTAGSPDSCWKPTPNNDLGAYLRTAGYGPKLEIHKG